MLIAADERKQIASLFSFLMQGEHLAMDCARWQAKIFSDPHSRRFLVNQAKQENFHAKVFKAGIGLLAPKGAGEVLAQRPMREYRRLLEEALERGDCMESLLGMQVILEGLGDVTLDRISAGFPARGAGFQRVRHLILGQEDAHHEFGIKRLHQLIQLQQHIPEHLLTRAEDYLSLTEQMMLELAPLFDYFDEDPAEYIAAQHEGLPQWLFRKAA